MQEIWDPSFSSQLYYFDDPYKASHLSHAIVILTEWEEFK